MHRQRRISPGQARFLLILALISGVALLLPASWTGGLISLVQVIVPFQDAAVRGTESVRRSFDTAEDAVPGAVYEALARRKTAMENQVASLTIRLAELEADVGLLEGTRSWQVGGERFGARGRLIPGRLINSDMAEWRSSRLLAAGSLQGIRPDQSVVSQHYSIGLGDADGVQSGMAILRRELLIGFVDQVGTHTSRVRLIGDVSIAMKVRIGRFHEDRFETADRYFWLVGRGNGRMEIRDVTRRDVQEGLVREGDAVVTASPPESAPASLPVAMKLGDVIDIRVDRGNPLLSILTIESPIDQDTLQRVYVYDAESP